MTWSARDGAPGGAGMASANGNGNGALTRRHAPPALERRDPMRAVRVSVIVPTLNEARNLPHVLPRIPPWVHEVVLVDGGSEDGTVDVARELLPDVRVVGQERPGQGAAPQAGVAGGGGGGGGERVAPGDRRRRGVYRPGGAAGIRRLSSGGRRLRKGLTL